VTNPTIAPERTGPSEVDRPVDEDDTERDRPWLVVVHNDPVNLMSYVAWVFQRLFGYDHTKAHKLMMDVHTKGRAIVSSGPREKAESDCYRLHAYGLWATLTKD
jgi:ATP-dependent Clp protease adaptor protein ClpS